MDVRTVSPEEVEQSAVRALGLDSDSLGLSSSEALCASLRRAASLLCPATPGRIATFVCDALTDLPGYDPDTRSELEDALDRLIAYGDLLELQTSDDPTAPRRLYLGPPSYVRRATGAYLLMGVRPEAAPLADDALMAAVDFEGHTRTLRAADDPEAVAILHAAGLRELSRDQWLRVPRLESAAAVVEDYSRRLHAAGPSGDVDGVTVLDSDTRTTYYRGRWTPPRQTHSGDFVIRRSQSYGADLWSFAAIANGAVVQLIDLPVLRHDHLARDEAWRLQAAIDEQSGHAQELRLRPGTTAATTALDLFAPVPTWAQRYLDVVCRPLGRSAGALFSYCVDSSEVSEIADFFAASLWMSINDQRERQPDDGT